MEKNGIKTDEYYKLKTPGKVEQGYISFSSCVLKEGRGYSIKCKVTCRCDKILLCAGENYIILRRVIPNESGVFTYFNLHREYIDNFINNAVSENQEVYIELKYKEQTMCSCLIVEKETEHIIQQEEDSAFDPFDTINTAYSWGVITNIKQLLEMNLIFGQMFIKIATKAMLQYNHLLTGEYIAPEGEFVIVGIPGDRDYGYNEFGRWVQTHRRYKDKKYNGYRLFYFSKVSKRMVRPVLVKN